MRLRTQLGTTLIEVLVVIVVFAVGILAVVQIFPKGFQVLLQARDRATAAALARDEVERIKARPDQIPEQIVAIRENNGVISIDSTRTPDDLGPLGNRLLENGVLLNGTSTVGDWARFSGPNAFRRVIGEGRRVPSPSQVGRNFGGLMVAAFGPLDTARAPIVYSNDFVRGGEPPVPASTFEENTYFVSADGSTLFLPRGDRARRFRVAFSGFLRSGSGSVRRDFGGLTTQVIQPAPAGIDGYPLQSVALSSLIGNAQLIGVEAETIRVQRVYRQLGVNGQFADGVNGRPLDPFEFKLLDPSLGVFLFNPTAAETRIQRRGGTSEPLEAKLDYDVLDWRILREDFRVTAGVVSQHRLSVGSIKVGGIDGPDGRPNSAIFLEQTGALTAASHPRADHLILVDLATGGVIAERSLRRTSGGEPTVLVRIDKTQGLITFTDADGNGSNGLTLELVSPGSTTSVDVSGDGRAVRALFMVRNEWAVQVQKAASDYRVVGRVPGPSTYYVGGTVTGIGGLRTRLYFPPSDVGRKVTIGQLFYEWDDGDVTRVGALYGQDFVIQYRTPDTVRPSLPSIDITDVVPEARSLSFDSGFVARSVKGGSMSVRVFQNPEKFRLGPNPDTNIRALEQWGRNWRRSSVETFVQRGDTTP
jgi:type II secretory pathway pseudopilin PulG